MKHKDHGLPHEEGDLFWHRWRCAECREARRMDREIRRRLKAAFADAPLPPGLETRILAAIGLPSEAETAPKELERIGPRRQLAALSLKGGAAVGRRGVLLAALAGTAALLRLSIRETPAQRLESVLAAMGRLRTARCSGKFTHYEVIRSSTKKQMDVEWWFQAPDLFRSEMGPDVPEWSVPAGTLIIRGDEAMSTSLRNPGRPLHRHQPQTRELAPVDFFTPEGLLHRAARSKYARIQDEPHPTAAASHRILTVEYGEGRERYPMRFKWVLTVHRATDRITHMEWLLEWREGWNWRPGAAETLNHFEYELPLPDELFRFDTVDRQHIPRASPAGEAPHL